MSNTNVPVALSPLSVEGSLAHVRWELPIKDGYTTEILVSNLSTGPYVLAKEVPEGVFASFIEGSQTIYVRVRSKRNADGALSAESSFLELKLSDETAESLEEKIKDIHDTIGSTQKQADFTFFQADGLLTVGAASVDYDQLANVTNDSAYQEILRKSYNTQEIGSKSIDNLDLDLVFHGACEEDCRWRWEIGSGENPTAWTPISEEILHTGVAFVPGPTPVDGDYVEFAIKGIRSFAEAATFPFAIRLVAKLEPTNTQPIYTRILSSALVKVTYNVA